MSEKQERPRDPNQLAKFVIDAATGGTVLPEAINVGKNADAVALGKLGGLKGGNARARKLSKARRKEIASKAAAARWGNRLRGTAITGVRCSEDDAITDYITVEFLLVRRQELETLIAHENEQAVLKTPEADRHKAKAAEYAIRLDEINWHIARC